MIHETDTESPKPVAEAESLVGVVSTDLLAARVEAVIEWAKKEEIPSVTVSAIQRNHGLNYVQAKGVFAALAQRFPVTGWDLLFAKSRGHHAHGESFYG